MPDPVEDLSNVPASVLRQQKDAEAKIEAARKIAEEGEPAPLVNEQNTVTPNPVIEPVKPQDSPAPHQPAISDGTTVDGQWEHKYSVLQGKYNKEIGEFNSTIVEMKAQMERQDKVIESMNNSTNSVQHKELGDDLNPEDFSGWGDEMRLMVDQVNALKSVIADQNRKLEQAPGNNGAQSEGLQTRVESLESEINDNRATTYLKYLDENIKGDWRVLNKDSNFNKWIDQQDPISLQPRRALLVAAAEGLRGDQVSSIFNLYISSNGSSTTHIADELPNGGGNGDFSESTETGTTQEDVMKAQSDFVQGKITEEDFDKIYSQFQSTLRRQQKS